MKPSIKLYSIFCFVILGCAPQYDQQKIDAYFKDALPQFNRQLTDVIVADIFTPPVASRIYAYSNIAAYEGIRFMDSTNVSLVGQLNGLKALSFPEKNKKYYYPLVSLVAFTDVAEALVFNMEKVAQMKTKMLEEVQDIGMDENTYENSVSYGDTLARQVLSWASKDGYLRRTALPRYSVTDDPGRWRPTPPDYIEAIEPHWNTIRPFVLDSAAQFDPGLPTTFDQSEGSEFYKEAQDVYETVKQIDSSKFEIAKFWDCNPNISHTNGHVMFFKQQISPGGHWIHITAQVLKEQNADPVMAAETLSLVSIGIADGFISAWDQKYKSNNTRPETYINKYIDADWSPILQTPAFPEHTSAHSVVSNAAGTILTHFFGAHYSFIDATEVPYGLPTRNFKSFMDASQEAAISRLYGGIHFRPAIEKGSQQGHAIGQFVLEKLKMHK